MILSLYLLSNKKIMIYLTRRERFNAAHKLHNPDWDDQKNHEVFGKCSNPNWHGHNYIMYVTVKGEVNPETGWVIDLKDLSKILKEHVIEQLDHKNINVDVEFMKGKWASTEVLCIEIWKVIEPKIKALGADLHCIKLEETENNYVEYYG